MENTFPEFCQSLLCSWYTSTRFSLMGSQYLPLCWFSVCSLQVSRWFFPSTCRRSLCSLLSATSCATVRESTCVKATSASASALTNSHNATVPPPTCRSWRTRSGEWPSPGLLRTRISRTQVTLEGPPVLLYFGNDVQIVLHFKWLFQIESTDSILCIVYWEVLNESNHLYFNQ